MAPILLLLHHRTFQNGPRFFILHTISVITHSYPIGSFLFVSLSLTRPFLIVLLIADASFTIIRIAYATPSIVLSF